MMIEDMKELSPKKRVLKALMGGKLDRVPVTCITGCQGAINVEMQKESGIHWPEAHKDAEKMARLAIAGYELSGIECVNIPFDNIVEAEALGCKAKYHEKMHLFPVVMDHPYTRPEDLKMPDNILELGRIPVVLQAIRIVREEVGDFLPIVSHVIGPFTLAGELVEIGKFLIWTLKNPDYVKAFLDFSTDFIIEFAKAQYRAGSDIVTVADGSLTPYMVTPDVLHQVIKPALIRIAYSLGGFRLLYIGGKEESMVPFLVECGYDGISVDETVNIARIRPVVGDSKILGNVSSKRTLTSGSPEEVKAEVKKAIEDGADLIEPSCGVPPDAPTVNIRAMVEAVKEFGGRR
ncbi:MAG: MtaA/CmuA family methyltransferase [Candidatus Methylarchaceae archaeon HK02M1]|nr:MtaA/CmuA family methyltransferase [Candidatus Methylarchaceae archaeon HK02M1]